MPLTLKRLQLSSYCALCCIVVFPACYKKLAQQNLTTYYDAQPVLTTEAQFTDISLPVQVRPHILAGSGPHATGITFVAHFELGDLVKFYQFEMERLGWKELHLFGFESEMLLVFEKPQKFCTVSIRPDNRVVIFFGTRS